jgi:pimeloyl-ACP methyl ester carboxylesterase
LLNPAMAYLAYQVFGEGPRDIVVTMAWVSHLELMWEMPEFVGFFKRLGGLGRVILFDKRGVGMSDRSPTSVSIEQRADDMIAVMTAAGSEHAVLLGWFDSGAAALVAAAQYLQRVRSVIVGDVLATTRPDDRHPWGGEVAVFEHLATMLESGAWGEATLLRFAAPALADDPRTHELVQKMGTHVSHAVHGSLAAARREGHRHTCLPAACECTGVIDPRRQPGDQCRRHALAGRTAP